MVLKSSAQLADSGLIFFPLPSNCGALCFVYPRALSLTACCHLSGGSGDASKDESLESSSLSFRVKDWREGAAPCHIF